MDNITLKSSFISLKVLLYYFGEVI